MNLRHDEINLRPSKDLARKLALVQQDTAYQSVTETVPVRPQKWAWLAKYSLHPDTANFPSYKLVIQGRAEGDDNNLYIVRVYQKLPGPITDGSSIVIPRAIPEEYILSATTVTTERKVEDGTAPDSNMGAGGQSSVTPVDGEAASSKKTSTEIISAGSTMRDYRVTDQELDVVLIETRTLIDVGAVAGSSAGISGTTLTEFRQRNQFKSEKIVSDLDFSKLDAFVRKFPGRAAIRLPNVLTGMNVVWEESNGDGSYSESANYAANGNNVHLNLDTRGAGEGSAGVMPEISPVVKEVWPDLPVLDVFFFTPINQTEAQILTKCGTVLGSTVNPWPIFKPTPMTIILTGQKLSGRANASARFSLSINDDGDESKATTVGLGTSTDYSSSIRAVVMPAMLRKRIDLGGGATKTSAPVVATAFARAGYVNSGTAIFPSGTRAVGAITPAIIPATVPDDWPESGLYAKEINIDLYKWAWQKVRVRVFDFSDAA